MTLVTWIFSETASGALRERLDLDRMLDYARTGDTVVVWKLDGSAARSSI